MSEPDDRHYVSWSVYLISMALIFCCFLLMQLAAAVDNRWMNVGVFLVFLAGLWAFIFANWRHRKHLEEKMDREPNPKESDVT